MPAPLTEIGDEVESIRFMLQDRLGFVSGTNRDFARLKKHFEGRPAQFISSELHRKYIPIAEDFGPVDFGVVLRFCDALSKRLATDRYTVFIYCVEDNFKAQRKLSLGLVSCAVPWLETRGGSHPVRM